MVAFEKMIIFLSKVNVIDLTSGLRYGLQYDCHCANINEKRD